QSLSVRGRRSSVPAALTIVATDSQIPSAEGSTIESMMSLIEAVGRSGDSCLGGDCGARLHATTRKIDTLTTKSPRNLDMTFPSSYLVVSRSPFEVRPGGDQRQTIEA